MKTRFAQFPEATDRRAAYALNKMLQKRKRNKEERNGDSLQNRVQEVRNARRKGSSRKFRRRLNSFRPAETPADRDLEDRPSRAHEDPHLFVYRQPAEIECPSPRSGIPAWITIRMHYVIDNFLFPLALPLSRAYTPAAGL